MQNPITFSKMLIEKMGFRGPLRFQGEAARFVYPLKDQVFKKWSEDYTVAKELWANIHPRYMFNKLLKHRKKERKKYIIPLILLLENEPAFVLLLHFVDMALSSPKFHYTHNGKLL